ncbi:hypothetical protein TSAR_015427 [Trichomalopsis sarcophagae]|uniref:Nuclear condensin complex subunit 3 C-terminal domain-containing protein n=1 Tax=Trichomalopsis sarcophagae TaxID=543379 RepID=A0A232FHU0_9HYME|nr:hypothetical protein TSAR_015427 [Trichomalopsis sarcophagae]
MVQKVYVDKISDIFTAVQYNRTCHQNYMKKLAKYYDKMDFDQFLEEFISNLRIPMCYMEKHPNVENTLQFAAKFAISLQPPQSENEEEYEEMCLLLERLFEFLLAHHEVKEVAVRFRVCYFLNMLLDTMGDNASIDDELCNRILQCMTDRILDKSPKVRAQAAIALHRLQEPNNKECPVIGVYLFHVAKDPSAEVRRVILAKMAKNKKTLDAAIKRTRDVDDSVRKMAYLFISKITVKSLTISQREQLINNGLQDRSDVVKKCVREILIPSWLRYYDQNYINFIKAIDAEHASETASLALGCLFKNAEIPYLIDQLPLDSTKFVPLEQLTSEVVLYWRCLAEFLKTENYTEEFEQILPELTPFCAYIKDFVTLTEARSNKQYEQVTQQFILYQLFEMIKLYDLADELGRRNLKELILETLQTYNCSNKISECIVKYFENVVPDVNDRVALLVEVINEIRMPTRTNLVLPMSDDERHERKMKQSKLAMQLLEIEDLEYAAIQRKDYTEAAALSKQAASITEEIRNLAKEPEILESQTPCEEKTDPETMIQCLQIMYYMMQSSTITTLSPTLRTLMESIALPYVSLQNNHEQVLSLALKCVGLCCHSDKDLAKKYFMMYCLYISESTSDDVWIAATEVIFDLLLKFGFEHFDITPDEENNPQNGNKRNRSVRLYSHNDEDINVNDKQIRTVDGSNNVIKVLMALLDNQVENLQSVATEGLCKLILHKRISSHQLISQLLILWHNPSTKSNPTLSQCLCNFFNLYMSKVSESQAILEEAYLPTLKMLANAPEMSPLQEVDALRVSEVIIGLTCCAIHNNYSTHNQLTYTILNEILNPDTEIELDVLIKSLKMLDVQLDGQNLKNDILKALDDAEDLLNGSGEKRLLRYIHQFREKITTNRIDETAQSENPENPGHSNNQEENVENAEEQDQDEDEEEEQDSDGDHEH